MDPHSNDDKTTLNLLITFMHAQSVRFVKAVITAARTFQTTSCSALTVCTLCTCALGEKHLLEEGHPQAVYVANHQSMLDLPAIGEIWPTETVVVAKQSLLYIPLFGFMFWALGNIFVNRGSHKQSINVMRGAADQVCLSACLSVGLYVYDCALQTECS